MKRSLMCFAAGALLILSLPAQVDYSTYAISMPFSTAQLTALSGDTVTTDIEGVAVDSSGTIYVQHEGSGFTDRILKLNPLAGTGTVLTTLDPLDNDGDYRPTGSILVFEGELIGADFQEAAGAQTGVVGIDVSSGASREITNTADLEGLEAQAPLSAGTLLMVRGNANGGDASLRTLNTSTGVVSAALITLTNPQAAAVSATGEVYVSDAGTDQILQIQNLLGTPTAVDVTPSTWTGNLEIQNMAIDQDGTLFATDRGDSLSLRIWTGNPTTSFDLPFDTIATAVGGAAGNLSPRDNRGLALRQISNEQVELYIANFNESAGVGIGIVRIVFGTPLVTAAESWALYR